MRNPVLWCLALASLPVTPVLAEYQGEVAAGYGERDYDSSRTESSGTSVSLRHFLSPVKAEQTPIRLAPFMERQSFLVIGWDESDAALGSFRKEQEAVSLAGDFQLGASPFRLGGGLAHRDIDGEPVQEYFANLDWYYHRFGALSLLGSRRSDNDDLNQVDVSETGVGLSQVVAFRDQHFSIQGQYLRQESTLQVAGTSSDVPAVTYSRRFFVSWFPNPKLGLGVAWQEQSIKYYELRSSDYEAEDQGHIFIVQYDPSERLGVTLGVGPGNGNEKIRLKWYGGSGSVGGTADLDYDALDASVTWRF